MYISFKNGAWDEGAVTHAYTYRFPFTNRFLQRDDCIENGVNPGMRDGFDYLSLLSREKFPLGTEITVNCSFSADAAPLFVVADSLDLCEDGVYRYGNFFEIVLYKKRNKRLALVERGKRRGSLAQASRSHLPRCRKSAPHRFGEG